MFPEMLASWFMIVVAGLSLQQELTQSSERVQEGKSLTFFNYDNFGYATSIGTCPCFLIPLSVSSKTGFVVFSSNVTHMGKQQFNVVIP
jgi:hypothetical protein